ncbi:MAG: ATP-binding protein [Myxococcota bacterium]|nr:ATP-binding protein [Myxococcota bacterium]
MSRSHLRVTLTLTALVLAVLALFVGLAQRGLREDERERTLQALEREAALVVELLATVPGGLQGGEAPRLDALATRAASTLGRRVTVVAPDGTVVGDSATPLARLSEVRAASAAVREAQGGRVGRGRDRLDGSPLVAVPIDGGGVVRLGLDPAALREEAGGLSTALLWAALAAVLAAAGLSHAFARASLHPLRQLQRLTSALAAGHLETRVPHGFDAETQEIARSIRQLAEQLRERLAETTEEKERLQAVLDGMTEGVLVVDPDGQVVLANDRVQEFFGIRGSLVGKTALGGIRHADLAELLVSAQHSHRPEGRMITVAHPASRTLRVHAVRFPVGAARPFGTVAVFHDVTELTQLEKMRRDFVANASHELRTPLAAIRGFAETLLGTRALSEDDRRSYLEVIDRHARRLGNLVGDLLELSKVESGKIEFELGPVDTEGLLAALIRDNRARFEEKELEVTHECKGDVVAWADTAALEQVVTNLLDNAVKYTDPGGRIHVGAEGDERWVRVSVQDTGIGIPEADLGRIFERFYRVDKARSRALGGTGLGLAIVKHIVHGLGGEISVESELGRGTVFALTLPRAGARS